MCITMEKLLQMDDSLSGQFNLLMISLCKQIVVQNVRFLICRGVIYRNTWRIGYKLCRYEKIIYYCNMEIWYDVDFVE